MSSAWEMSCKKYSNIINKTNPNKNTGFLKKSNKTNMPNRTTTKGVFAGKNILINGIS